MRVGVVGTGYLGRLHARILTEMPEADVAGFVEPDDAIAAEIIGDAEAEALRFRRRARARDRLRRRRDADHDALRRRARAARSRLRRDGREADHADGR